MHSYTRARQRPRLLEKGIAAIGLAMHPVLAAIARLAGQNSLLARLASKTKKFPDILLDDAPWSATTKPPITGRPGMEPPARRFHRGGCRQPPPGTPWTELDSAYWFYVRNRTMSLDWDIIVRSLKDAAGIHERIGS